MTHSQKRFIRRILQALYLEKPLRALYRAALRLRFRLRYGNRQIHQIVVGGKTVLFSVEDLFSRRYFLLDEDRTYEMLVQQFIVERLPQAKTFVDVGANLGYYTCMASKLMLDGKVYSFEVDELNLGLLKRNVELNQAMNVQIEHCAVSDTKGSIEYIRDTDSPSLGFLLSADRERDSQFGQLVQVDSVPLDEYFLDGMPVPAVIKIDVEGAEYKVLSGMKRMLTENPLQLFIEIHPERILYFGATVSDVLNLLMDHQYTVYELTKVIAGENLNRLTPLQPLSRNAVLTMNNILYAHKDLPIHNGNP